MGHESQLTYNSHDCHQNVTFQSTCTLTIVFFLIIIIIIIITTIIIIITIICLSTCISNIFSQALLCLSSLSSNGTWNSSISIKKGNEVSWTVILRSIVFKPEAEYHQITSEPRASDLLPRQLWQFAIYLLY